MGIKYDKEVWMELLREGNWNGLDYTPKFLFEMATSYDPLLLKAPITLGHVSSWDDQKEPAYGHVLELKVEDPPGDKDPVKLLGKVGLLKDGVDLIESGKYTERSICWDMYYPMMGIPYLCHVALLGAVNPAATGMDELHLSAPMQVIDDSVFEIKPETEKAFFLSRPVNLIWDVTDNWIRYRVRPPSRFREDSYVTRWFNKSEGIQSVLGKLKPEYVPEGNGADSLAIQNVMFDKEKGWDLAKSKSWVSDHEGSLAHNDQTKFDDSDTEPEKEIEPETATESLNITVESTSTEENTGGEETVADETTAVITPPVKPEVITVEQGSSVDLKTQNTLLEQKVSELNTKLFAEQTKKHDELKRSLADLRLSNLRIKVETMLAEGFITPAQAEYLPEALAAIPEDAKIHDDKHDKDLSATEILMEAIKANGRLKLKHQFEFPDETKQVKYADLETARTSKKVKGVDVAEVMRDLMLNDKNLTPAEALTRATLECGGKS